ncbi:primosomal protein DnaT [Candidatus Profftia tarda]|uniref:Primosomal protein 1 n=1 Tax=Candidatus Profftia tarda TaxID=1177216 RepID=A0A8E4GIV4_9ENTR|nr:primosomal protein DnaT [Candidatus Profftia tarda]CAD6509264.1 Primosomal protein 1 [Candidatus Profftia tarda]
MSVKILSSSITNLNEFSTNPITALTSTDCGIIAVLDDSAPIPVFYAVTPKRMADLLALEKLGNTGNSHVFLKDDLCNNYLLDPLTEYRANSCGKFVMHSGWHPDNDFLHMAAIWGYILKTPVTRTELASFVSYWEAEGKAFHHVQWQQKLARSIQQNRITNRTRSKLDMNNVFKDTYSIPKGFRG